MEIENLNLWFNKKTRLWGVSGRIHGRLYQMMNLETRPTRQVAWYLLRAKHIRNL